MKQAPTQLGQANKALRDGKYYEAIRLYEEVLEKNPALKKACFFNLSLAQRKLQGTKHDRNPFGGTAFDLELPFQIEQGSSTPQHDFIKSVTSNLEARDLLTFDIWDTVLRRVCDPDEIKLRSARVLWLLCAQPDDDHKHTTPTKLFWLRKDAECKVADEHYEYRIESVLQEWLKLNGVADAAQIKRFSAQILESELLAERVATRPDATILSLLKSIEDNRTLAISDYYHSSSNLASILRHHGLEDYFDRVYVSCDWMKTKRVGSLYDLVLREENVHPSRITHVGDNLHSDYEKASEKGIRAFLYESPMEDARISDLKQTFEDYLVGNLTRHYKNILSLLDYPRHVSPTGDMANISNLAVAGKLLSPIVVGFVLFCMQEAIRRQCKSIFFFAREGVFFKRIYEELVRADVFDLSQYPQPEILYVSRRSTFSASMRELSVSQMMRMWSMYSTQSVNAMACSLNLDTNTVAAFARDYGLEPDSPIQYPWKSEQFRAFFHSPEFQGYSGSVLATQYARLLHHLDQAGFESEADIDRFVVDIGWRGTIQDNICNVVNGRVHGAYLALKGYLNQQPENSTKRAFLSNDNIADHFDLGDVAALEFILNVPGGSTIGYEKDGSPLKEIFPGEEAVINNQVAAIQSGIVEGAGRLAQYLRQHGLIAENLIPLSRHLVTCYLTAPPTCIADAFLGLTHNETFGTGKVDQIALHTNTDELAQLADEALHSTLHRLRSEQRWSASVFNTTQFKNFAAALRPDQILNIPCSDIRKSVFSIVRPESRGNSVSLFTPSPLAGSGGHRTILNVAKGLAREGFDVHVMLESVNSDLNYIEMELAGYPIKLHKKWNNGVRTQVAIATIAHSAKYVREVFSSSIGAYFIQDYEAEFHPLSDGYVRGQNSYALGLAPICVGHWLPHVLRKQFGVGSAYCGLGVDSKVYYPIPNILKKDMVVCLYQPDKWRRMPETTLSALALVKQMRPQTEILLYGSNVQADLPFEATQRGMVHDLSELNIIYNEATVGLCLSLTNPSRIPFEYMAAGCVPVDLYRYNNLFDYSEDSALLAFQSANSIAAAIIYMLDNKEECDRRRKGGTTLAQQRTLNWEIDAAVNSIKQLLVKGSGFDIEARKYTYKGNPFISESDAHARVQHFCSWQLGLAKDLADRL